MKTQLTTTQRVVLTHAHENSEGKIIWFPETIKGGARQNVIDGLVNRGLITNNGNNWIISPEGYTAISISRRGPITIQALDAVIDAATAVSTEPAKTPRTRDNSKQAQVIAMLRRPEGATIVQICEATGWQQHTVRGTISGTLRKRQGLHVVLIQDAMGAKAYRIAKDATAEWTTGAKGCPYCGHPSQHWSPAQCNGPACLVRDCPDEDQQHV